jgi:hypothetical protein
MLVRGYRITWGIKVSDPQLVTMDNFAHAETAHYFTEQLAKAPVNEYSHNREPVTVDNQVIIRSNVDLIYSYAVVDVTQEATFSLARHRSTRWLRSSTRTTTCPPCLSRAVTDRTPPGSDDENSRIRPGTDRDHRGPGTRPPTAGSAQRESPATRHEHKTVQHPTRTTSPPHE